MYWQLLWWKLSLFLLRLTTRPRLYRQKGQTCWRQRANHHHAPLFGVRLKGGDSFLSASNISPLRLRNQEIRLSNWILMDRPWRPVLSARWADTQRPDTEEGEQIIGWQADCPWQGFCMMGWKAATLLSGREPHRQPHFPDCCWESPPLGKKKSTFTFSGKALQPPTACHVELPVKMMAAYWFHLTSVPHPISGSGLSQRGDSQLRLWDKCYMFHCL